MKNGEKYRDKIMKHYKGFSGYCGFVNDKILKPCGFRCNELYCTQCNAIQHIWLDEEYKDTEEPKVDWTQVDVDTPILVSSKDRGIWHRRYFAKYEDGRVFAWRAGSTSWSADSKEDCIGWEYAKLTEGE